MKTSPFLGNAMSRTLSWDSFQDWRQRSRLSSKTMSAIAMGAILGLSLFSIDGFLEGNMYLCLGAMFLAFIPYLIWSSYRRAGSLDILAPDLGFPLAYILYLTCGSIALPIQTQFGLVLPWIVWFYYIVGLVAYLVGVRLLRAPGPEALAHGARKHFWNARQFLAVTFGLLAIGAAARAVTVRSSGFEILRASDESARVAGSKGIWAVLALCLAPAFECMLIFMLVKKPKGPLRILLLACMTLIGLNAIATNNRTPLLSIALAAVVILHYAGKRFSFASLVVFGILATAFASALGTFRDVSEWGDQRIQELDKKGFSQQTYWLMNGYEAVRLPTEVFDMVIQHFPELEHYTYGQTSLAEFGTFLPGPTLEPGRVIKTKLRLEFVGFGAAATVLGPLWVDGGVIGIFVGMFLIGLGSKALHRKMLLSQNYVWVLIYAWFMQNAFKAIKDDIIPDLSLLFVLAIFPCVDLVASTSFDGWRRPS
jgi:oligosaccharide repeat unit polymerase